MSNTDTLPPPEAATTSADSAPNDPRQAGWRDEIHTPECGVFNGNVPLDDIERDPGNRVPCDSDIEDLARSIEAEGLLQPVTLRDLGGNKYRIIAGETRVLAFRKLGRPTIPAMIRPRDDEQGFRPGPSQGDVAKRLVENLHRTDLNPVDEARGYKQLCELGRTQKEVGALFGKSQPVIANAIRILALPEEVLDLVREGKLSGAHAVSLARFAKFPRIVSRMADQAVDDEVTAKELDYDEVPFVRELRGFVIDIKTRGHSWDKDPVYTVPPALLERDEFIESDWCVYYLREPGTEDLWTPEKKRQDEAREAKAAAAAKKDAQALASGKKTKEQIEREKKVAANRKLRFEIGATFDGAIDALKAAKEITPDMLGVLISHALADGRNGNRLDDAEEFIGIDIPNTAKRKGDDAWKDDIDYLELLEAGPLAAVKLAVAAILKRHHDEDVRFASKVSPEMRLIAQSAPPLTSQQRIERAAQKVGITSAKLVVVAGDLMQPETKVAEVAKRHKVEPAKAKAVRALVECDEALAGACASAHATAEALLNKDPLRAAVVAKAKAAKATKGAKKK